MVCNVHAFGLTESCKLVKKYERGDLQKCDWLDKLAFRRMEEIHAVSLFLHLNVLQDVSSYSIRRKRINRIISSCILTYHDSIFLLFLANLSVFLLRFCLSIVSDLDIRKQLISLLFYPHHKRLYIRFKVHSCQIPHYGRLWTRK